MNKIVIILVLLLLVIGAEAAEAKVSFRSKKRDLIPFLYSDYSFCPILAYRLWVSNQIEVVDSQHYRLSGKVV